MSIAGTLSGLDGQPYFGTFHVRISQAATGTADGDEVVSVGKYVAADALGSFDVSLGVLPIDPMRNVVVQIHPWVPGVGFADSLFATTNPVHGQGYLDRLRPTNTQEPGPIAYVLDMGEFQIQPAPFIGSVTLKDYGDAAVPVAVVPDITDGHRAGSFLPQDTHLLFEDLPIAFYSWAIAPDQNWCVSSESFGNQVIGGTSFKKGTSIEVRPSSTASLWVDVDMAALPSAYRWTYFPAGDYVPKNYGTLSAAQWKRAVRARTRVNGRPVGKRLIPFLQPGNYVLEVWPEVPTPTGDPLFVANFAMTLQDLHLAVPGPQ